LYFRQNREKPWLTKEVNELLGCWIRKSDIGFEWGSGSSTYWFAQKAKFITSIEHNPEWHKIVNKKITDKSIAHKVKLNLLPEQKTPPQEEEYVQIIKKIKDNTLDFCLVDGILRDQCALASLQKIKKGGILVIDDIQRYFPDTINTKAPYARREGDGYQSKTWQKVGKMTDGWRQIRFSNGLKDTGIFFKP